jgi:hypothetical protein
MLYFYYFLSQYVNELCNALVYGDKFRAYGL